MKDVKTLHKGITTWQGENQIQVIKLHYTADPAKDENWVAEHKPKAPNEEWWEQEQEIRFDARQGSRVYHQYRDDETTLVDPFPIPKEWTRYYCLDPHPRTPHAHLWTAVSPAGDLYCYRELWPSKISGTNKNIPEDERVYPIRWYVEAMKYLQSGAGTQVKIGDRMIEGNPENVFGEEEIFRQLIDYAARAFGKDADNPDAINYQERYENHASDLNLSLRFEDCVKDNDAAYQEVNDWLRPRPTMGANGEVVQRSRIRIFKSGWWTSPSGEKVWFEGCPELRWELLHNRIRMLLPHQADVKDPEMAVLQKRNHVADDLKYIVMSKPYFYKKQSKVGSWKPAYDGVGY